MTPELPGSFNRRYVFVRPFPCSYIIEQDVCFLTLCDRNFNKKLAYSFLEDLSQEFYNQYGHKINTATRPYSFIEFGEARACQAVRFHFKGTKILRVRVFNEI